MIPFYCFLLSELDLIQRVEGITVCSSLFRSESTALVGVGMVIGWTSLVCLSSGFLFSGSRLVEGEWRTTLELRYRERSIEERGMNE